MTILEKDCFAHTPSSRYDHSMFKRAFLSPLVSSGIIIAILSAISFGLYPPAARAVYADGGNAAFMMIATTIARALVMYAFCLFTAKKLFMHRHEITASATGGLFQAISVFGIFGALAFVPGPVMIIIVFSHTLMLLFYMAWRGEAKLNVLTVLTTLAALLGLSFVLDLWYQDIVYDWRGMALAFMAAVATVTRVYVFGKQTKIKNPAVVGAENFIFAALFILPVAFFSWPQLPETFTGYFYTLLACLSLAGGTFGMFYGIAKLGAFKFSLFLKLEPVFTTLFSIVLLGELLTLPQYMGMALVMGSLIAYQVLEKK